MKWFKKRKKLLELTDEELDKRIQEEKGTLKLFCVMGLLFSIISIGISVFMAIEIDWVDLLLIGCFVAIVNLQMFILNNSKIEKRIREAIENVK